MTDRNAVSHHSWQSVPRALLYPLELEASLLILACTLVIWLASTSLFGLPIALAFAVGLAQFLLLSLKHSALGHQRPPRMSASEFRQLGAAPLKLLLVIALWSALIAEIGKFSPATGFALTIIGFLFLPAFTALIALEESLHYALHPLRLIKFVWRGGLIYLLFAAFTAVLLQRSQIGVDATSLVFSMPQLGSLVWFATAMYFATAATHVLGSIAFVAHDFSPPAGHSVGVDKEQDVDSPQTIAAKLDTLLRTADRETTLHEWRAHAERDHVFQSALLAALLQQRAWALVPWQAQRTVTMLLRAHRRGDALRVAMQTLTTHASFSTTEAAEWQALCETAAQSGRSDWLATLASQVADKFPQNDILLEIALLHASHLAHQQEDVAQALQVLAPYGDCRDHPRYPQLAQLQRALAEIARDS